MTEHVINACEVGEFETKRRMALLSPRAGLDRVIGTYCAVGRGTAAKSRCASRLSTSVIGLCIFEGTHIHPSRRLQLPSAGVLGDTVQPGQALGMSKSRNIVLA